MRLHHWAAWGSPKAQDHRNTADCLIFQTMQCHRKWALPAQEGSDTRANTEENTWYLIQAAGNDSESLWQRAFVCEREKNNVCVHQVREDVCERMWCVTLHFHADTEGPLFSQCEREQDGRLSPQAQISLSYLTQQILCKSSRSVIPQPLQESSSFVALHILSFFLPSILSLPLWVWE